MATWDVIQIYGGSTPHILAKPPLLPYHSQLVGNSHWHRNLRFALSTGVVPDISGGDGSPRRPRSGSLLLKAEGEGYVDARRLGIDVDITVSGPTIRTRVPRFSRIRPEDWVEAVYVYPLPGRRRRGHAPNGDRRARRHR